MVKLLICFLSYYIINIQNRAGTKFGGFESTGVASPLGSLFLYTKSNISNLSICTVSAITFSIIMINANVHYVTINDINMVSLNKISSVISKEECTMYAYM